MVLGRKRDVVDAADTGVIVPGEKRDPHLETGVYGYDIENNGPPGRKMSRVAGPVSGGIVGDSDSDSALTIGKQLELEANNAIKYRSCSWKKVNRLSFCFLPAPPLFLSPFPFAAGSSLARSAQGRAASLSESEPFSDRDWVP